MEKLENLPPVYYINLDHRVDKRAHMERNVVSSPHVKSTRVSATDGRVDNTALMYQGVVPPRLKPTEVACTLSHLRAIREWLTTSDTETVLICEDDVSLETVDSWPFTWSEVVNKLPYYWDVFQCCITYHPLHPATISLHMHQTTDFSDVCYLIRRSYAEKLMSLYWRDGVWKLDYSSVLPLTAEEAVYRPGVCFSLPLFTYTNEFESSIQTREHMNSYHVPSREFICNVWRQVKHGKVDLLDMTKQVTLPPMMKR